MTTVLIVDDHAGFRATARRLLETSGFEVVGEAPDGESGVEAARELRPDLVLLDVQLPGIDGFETARRMTADAADGGPAVVLTSTRAADDFGPLIAESGARGFLSKGRLSAAAIQEIAG